MSQSTKTYSLLSSSEKTYPQRITKPKTRCQDSVTCRPEHVTANFRMVAVALMMLFAFCLLLFVWNIVLWRELERLQNDLVSLSKKTEQSASFPRTDCVVSTPSEANRLEMETEERGRKRHVGRKFQKKMDDGQQDQPPKRGKRSAIGDMNDSPLHAPASINSEQGLLSRIRRSPTTESTGGRKKGKGKRGRGKKPKRERKGRRYRAPPAVSQQAKALHVPIQGQLPYRGEIISDPEGVIRIWDRDSALATGFTVSSDGAQVQQDGVYFIYSQVTFKMQSGIEVHEKIMTGTTMSSFLSSCSNPVPKSNTSQYITCYSSGIKKLRVDDRIQVKVYPVHLTVFANPEYTYFGAFLIGSYQG